MRSIKQNHTDNENQETLSELATLRSTLADSDEVNVIIIMKIIII